MKNKKIISLTAMSLVMGTTIATANADSLRERFRVPAGVSENIQAEKEAFKGGMVRGMDFSVEDRETLKTAVENANYNSWKTVMEKVGSDKTDEYLTEEKFNILVRAYKLQASGDRSGAMTLLDDSDIPGSMLMLGGGKMHGGRGEMGFGYEGNQEALLATYKSGDFAAWKALMDERGGCKILEIVNESNFAKFAEAKILQSEGKLSEAKEILDELGFPFQERGAGPMRNAGAAKAAVN